MRPPTHSLTFAVAAALLVFLFRKKWDWSWIVFAAIASHVVRDAYGGGTPIFYPSKISMIPYWSYLVVEYLLLITSQMIGGNKFYKLK
jgi:membrane-bound metal-dependent hydrolase YbcI (DUF457 family)